MNIPLHFWKSLAKTPAKETHHCPSPESRYGSPRWQWLPRLVWQANRCSPLMEWKEEEGTCAASQVRERKDETRTRIALACPPATATPSPLASLLERAGHEEGGRKEGNGCLKKRGLAASLPPCLPDSTPHSVLEMGGWPIFSCKAKFTESNET